MLKLADQNDARHPYFSCRLINPGTTYSNRDVGEPVREDPFCALTVRVPLAHGFVAVPDFDVVDNEVLGVDVLEQDVRDLVKQREQDLIEPFAASGRADDRVSIDDHGAPVDLGAGEPFDVDQAYTDLAEQVGQVLEVPGGLEGA